MCLKNLEVNPKTFHGNRDFNNKSINCCFLTSIFHLHIHLTYTWPLFISGATERIKLHWLNFKRMLASLCSQRVRTFPVTCENLKWNMRTFSAMNSIEIHHSRLCSDARCWDGPNKGGSHCFSELLSPTRHDLRHFYSLQSRNKKWSTRKHLTQVDLFPW